MPSKHSRSRAVFSGLTGWERWPSSRPPRRSRPTTAFRRDSTSATRSPGAGASPKRASGRWRRVASSGGDVRALAERFPRGVSARRAVLRVGDAGGAAYHRRAGVSGPGTRRPPTRSRCRGAEDARRPGVSRPVLRSRRPSSHRCSAGRSGSGHAHCPSSATTGAGGAPSGSFRST